MKDGEVDTAEFSLMIDEFMKHGFNYFDTAHGYISGKSETAIRECLSSRYPRESFFLVNKLSGSYFSSREEIRPFFESQLLACGVDYFDLYLMHAQNKQLYERYKSQSAYEEALSLLKEGKIKHFGISFHDKAQVLEEILSEYPEIEAVQIQFNYADYDDASVESRKCYDVCRKYGKPIIVMEPVKGGSLARLPAAASDVIASLGGGSPAAYALRFAAGFDGVEMVLSGVSTLDMMRENATVMENPEPLSERERAAVDEVRAILHNKNVISCTACRYCTDGCPMNISIPDLFACMNGKQLWNDWNAEYYYEVHTHDKGLASACIECGACEDICPQKLPIRELLKTVSAEFEKDGEKQNSDES